MKIIGINAYHGDSSACLVVDGKLLAAVEEERFRRIKHWAGLPTESIRYCLDQGGLTLDQIDAIAINQNGKANFWKKLAFIFTKRPNVNFILDRFKNKNERRSIPSQLAQFFPDQQFKGKLHSIEHHLQEMTPLLKSNQ